MGYECLYTNIALVEDVVGEFILDGYILTVTVFLDFMHESTILVHSTNTNGYGKISFTFFLYMKWSGIRSTDGLLIMVANIYTVISVQVSLFVTISHLNYTTYHHTLHRLCQDYEEG